MTGIERFYPLRQPENVTILRITTQLAVEISMAEGFWLVAAIIVLVLAWVLSKVRYYMKKSEQQWQDVDKTKLREWEEDEDW
jgi:positive regulator of sigma E activity